MRIVGLAIFFKREKKRERSGERIGDEKGEK